MSPNLNTPARIKCVIVCFCAILLCVLCQTNTLQLNPLIQPALTLRLLPVMEMVTIHQTVIMTILTVMRHLR